MAFCGQCGSSISELDKFCQACGASQAAQPGQIVTPPPAAPPRQITPAPPQYVQPQYAPPPQYVQPQYAPPPHMQPQQAAPHSHYQQNQQYQQQPHYQQHQQYQQQPQQYAPAQHVYAPPAGGGDRATIGKVLAIGGAIAGLMGYYVAPLVSQFGESMTTAEIVDLSKGAEGAPTVLEFWPILLIAAGLVVVGALLASSSAAGVGLAVAGGIAGAGWGIWLVAEIMSEAEDFPMSFGPYLIIGGFVVALVGASMSRSRAR